MSDTDGGAWKAARGSAIERDGGRCRFCGVTESEYQENHDRGLHVHHIVPKAEGGRNTPENLITVCASCHQTLEQTHGKAMKRLKREHSDLRENIEELLADAESHARRDFKYGVEVPNDLLPLEDGIVPQYAIDQMDSKQFNAYQMGRYEGIKFAVEHIRGAFDGSGSE